MKVMQREIEIERKKKSVRKKRGRQETMLKDEDCNIMKNWEDAKNQMMLMDKY